MTVKEIKAFVENYPVKEISFNYPKSPLVSVCVITYQHEPFIRDCLDGILNQKVDFEYEILIGDDGSTDGTREICEEYARKYPGKIRLFLHNQEAEFNGKKMLSYQANAYFNFFSAKGKYIAYCEGDDYWLPEDKLQRQINILEKYPDCSITCGGYRINFSDCEQKSVVEIKPERELIGNGYFFDLEEHLDKWKIKFLTTVFRNNPEIFRITMGYKYARDVHLFYHLLKEGNGFYFCEELGVYNKHRGGIIGSLERIEKRYHAYLIYRELYHKTEDEVIRLKYFSYILKAFLYKKQNAKGFNKINRFKVWKEGNSIAKTKEERVLMFKSFVRSYK